MFKDKIGSIVTFCATGEICVFYSSRVRSFEGELGFGGSGHII